MHFVEIDGISAQEAALRLAEQPGLAWLDGDCAVGPFGTALGTVEAPKEDGRFSFVTADPVETWRVPGSAPEPLALFDELSRRWPGEPLPGALPCAPPRCIGYVAYDACLDAGSRAAGREPVAMFARYDACIVFDHAESRVIVAGDDTGACERLIAKLRAPPREPTASAGALIAADPTKHALAIELALEHIARGDIYQVNLARELSASYDGDALALALAMRARSPVPFGFFFDDGERAVVGRSMERFLRWNRATRELITRPIKGTLARSGDDHAEAARLARDPKERAEHAMIIDLMRNDLSRVAELGTVSVPQIMAVERYAGLSHLVSTVRCTTRAECGPRALLEAAFPAGSITGTPKLRAIEIIAALEPAARGVYTGTYGYLDRAGGLSLAVAIRTAVVERGRARYFAGGGIVEASQVERELAETTLKARVFSDAIADLSAPRVVR